MGKIIRIFLGSSIVEFATERMIIENFIHTMGMEFFKKYKVLLEPLLCENFDDAYTAIRKQEEYNEKIRSCEYCFFIFFTKAGKYTREEFEVARQQFEQSGKPRIYVYFKTVEEGKAEQSLYDFMDELDKVFGHYYGTFSHIDTIKLRILLSLKLSEMDFLEIKTEGEHCLIDGKPVIPVEHIAEFANNQTLSALYTELRELEPTYYQLRAVYEKGDCDNELYRKYSQIASRRQTLLDEIDELQRLIFDVSMRMVRDDVHGEITTRQKEAYRLFERGDYEGCMSVLNAADIDSDFLRDRQRIKQQELAVCKKYIREHKTAIDILMSMTAYAERFAEIETRYQKIVPVIFEMQIELDTAREYVQYLIDQNQDEKALAVAERLLPLCDEREGQAALYHRMGIICSRGNRPEQAEAFYEKAISIHEKLASDDPDRFEPELAESYNNAGAFYNARRQPEKAKALYLAAINIRKKLASRDPRRFEPDLANSYNDVGFFYYSQRQHEKAEQLYLQAIAIYEKLVLIDPKQFEASLAISYNNVGIFYTKHNRLQDAEFYYSKAINIREKLVADNPERFEPTLATSYYNAGNFFAEQGRTDEAEAFYRKAIAIREKLASHHPERFNPYLAVTYHNYALIKHEQLFFDLALKLAKTNPQHPWCKQIIEQLG